MPSALSHVAFWYTALGAPGQSLPARSPLAPEAEDRRAQELARRLRQTPPERRGPLVEVLRARAALLPWSQIHPSWLEPIFLTLPPQWRLWALAALPPELRERLDEDRSSGDSAILAPRAPSWWPAFFSAHVKHALAYPELEPWASEGEELPGRLWEWPEGELTRLLAVHGTRGFVSALRSMDRAEAQQWMWRLPPQCQPLAQETVTRSLFYEDPFWAVIFRALEAEFPALEARIFRAALADWLRAGRQQGCEPALRRLAFRLPRRWGEWMLARLDTAPEWMEMPVVPSLAEWARALDAASSRTAKEVRA
jgi:hypothetical protein